ncbi:hypothetical protein CROQUDRAFT_52314 [Cronartium quercuum f. sp. fusiforme G11]|uniref:Uncharacterized protein n=1 Tax=Cronartium quercuum f. sp. fusiforme G11 TaxID=708437 RepID=A0A9P6NB43_9BASI|nr:hypothetical protein CROQUDRAFT_52314 [Cronartium quercuum f. sp. fusiforme G11]
MDGTIMRTMCQLQRLLAEYPPPSEPQSKKNLWTRSIILTLETYDQLLHYIRIWNPQARDYREGPHPKNSVIVTRYASPIQHQYIQKASKKFLVSPLAPNNCICYMRMGRKKYAMVKQIYRFEGALGNTECAVLVRLVNDCFRKDLKSPSKHFQYTLYLLRTVVGEIGEDKFFLSPEDITSVAVYRLLLSHTFGLKDGGIILTSVLFSHSLVV